MKQATFFGKKGFHFFKNEAPEVSDEHQMRAGAHSMRPAHEAEQQHAHHHAHAMHHGTPLALSSPGCKNKITLVRGRDDTRRFLSDLGFVEGADVSVVSANGGDIIVQVKGSRVALSRHMAQRIMVS